MHDFSVTDSCVLKHYNSHPRPVAANASQGSNDSTMEGRRHENEFCKWCGCWCDVMCTQCNSFICWNCTWTCDICGQYVCFVDFDPTSCVENHVNSHPQPEADEEEDDNDEGQPSMALGVTIITSGPRICRNPSCLKKQLTLDEGEEKERQRQERAEAKIREGENQDKLRQKHKTKLENMKEGRKKPYEPPKEIKTMLEKKVTWNDLVEVTIWRHIANPGNKPLNPKKVAAAMDYHPDKLYKVVMALTEDEKAEGFAIAAKDCRRIQLAQQKKTAGDLRAEVQTSMAGDRAKRIRVGTDCSGIETPLIALRNLGIEFDHVFSS